MKLLSKTHITGIALFFLGAFFILNAHSNAGGEEKSQFILDTEAAIRSNENWLKGTLDAQEMKMTRQELHDYLAGEGNNKGEVTKRKESNIYHAGKLSSECYQMDWQNLTSFPVENCSK